MVLNVMCYFFETRCIGRCNWTRVRGRRGAQNYYTIRANLAVYPLRHEAFRQISFSNPI